MATTTRPSHSTRLADDGTYDHRRSQFKGQYDDSWAAVIGIDDYTSYRKLKFAAADAVAMARALIEHRRFPSKHVFLLIQPRADLPLPDELSRWLGANRGELGSVGDDASKAAIEQLLYETIPSNAKADDRVLIYFAGHGVPRAVNQDVRTASPYLAPAPARHGYWREHLDLDDVLKEGNFLAAKHVLYVFDACCSGLADDRGSEQPKRYERKMLYRKARQCLTAGTREQRVDDAWSGSHSPFTGALLELLDGSIETRDDEALCVSTVGAMLKVAVAKLGTASEQVPALFTTRGDRGGEFVFAAKHAPISLHEQATIARTLVDLAGRQLDEPAPIEFAAKLWNEISAATRQGQPLWVEALREHARTQVLLRKPRLAIAELDAASVGGDPEAELLRAIAWLQVDQQEQAAGAPDKAASALDEFLRLHEVTPHRYGDWARWATDVARQPRARRFALLIGVDEIPSISGSRLQGSGRDVTAMEKLLRNQLGFTHVTTLVDEGAAITDITAAFERLASETKPEDSFICYISGPGYLHGDTVIYPSHDLDLVERRYLTDVHIDDAMRSIAAHDKLLVTDGPHLAPEPTARLAGYRFLHSGSQDARRHEILTKDGEHRGTFSYSFERAVRELGNAPLRRIVSRVRASLARGRTPQTPDLVGSSSAMLLESQRPELEIIDLAEVSHRSFPGERIEAFVGRIKEFERAAMKRWQPVDLSPLWLAIGRARLARREPDLAIAALAHAAHHPGVGLSIIEAQLRAERYRESWKQWRTAPLDSAMEMGERADIARLDDLLEGLREVTRRALLVATDDANSTRARELLEQVRVALRDRFAMREDNLTMRLNPSRDELFSAFHELIATARGPAFFLFIGPGFDGEEVWLSTRAEGRIELQIRASELHALVDGRDDVTSALLITRNEPPPATQNSAGSQPQRHEHAEVGAATLVVAPRQHRNLELSATGLAIEQSVRVLERSGHPAFTFVDWRSQIEDPYSSRLSGRSEAGILPFPLERDRALSLLREIEHAPARPTLDLLERLSTQPENAAEVWLQIAILRAQLGRYEDAKLAADEALARRRADHPERSRIAQGASATNKFPEAHYHRGRILLALARYTEADAEFRNAIEEQADHARAHYFRERAIRALNGSDLEKLRAESISHYLQYGAPFGVDEEVSWPV